MASSIAAAKRPGLAVTISRFSLDAGNSLCMLKYGSMTRMSSWPGKDVARPLHDADDLELVAVDVDPLADGILAVHQRSRDVGAHHGHGHAMLIFDVGEETPFRNVRLAALRIRLFGSGDIGADTVRCLCSARC